MKVKTMCLRKCLNSALSIPILSLLLVLLVTSVAQAAPVTTADAKTAVMNWLVLENKPLGSDLSGAIRDVRTYTGDKGAPLYYVVCLNPSGYVVVSADDLVEPIIAFSPDGNYEPVPDNPMYALVISDLGGRMQHAKSLQGGPTYAPEGEELTANQKWNQLLAGAPPPLEGLSSVSDPRVDPFVLSKWNQSGDRSCNSATYNYYTPPGPDGTATNYPCGYVATAMAQLMRYWQWPTAGVGTSSFNISVCGGTPYAHPLDGGNGSGGAYVWTEMDLDPSCPDEATRQAIGHLCHDAGVAVSTNYCNTGSGADTLQAADALKNTMGYSNAKKGYNSGSELTSEPRNRMINANLHASYPVILGITGTSGDHAVVCDGYGYNSSTMYHHLNLGWSGTNTAWYNLPNIDSSPSFTTLNKCVYNVFTTGTGEIIAGRVTDSISGLPISGVTVSAGGSSTDTTDSRGIYALRVASSTTYTVIPQKSGYVFTPASTSVTTGTSTDNSTTCGNKWPIDFTGAIDAYEPDNTCATAQVILPGVPQTHSISPVGDVDWVKFTLTQLSSVVLETSGVSGDTEMYLYSDCGGPLVEYDDDDGPGSFSRIDRDCGVDALPAGTYYAKINEWGSNNEIASYTLTLTVTPCGCTPTAPTNPGSTNVTESGIRWTWSDSSSDETGFKVYADPTTTYPPATLRETVAAGSTYWDYTSLTGNCMYGFQVAATNACGDSTKTSAIAKYTLAGAPSYGNNISCDKSTNTWYPGGTMFTFTNPAGFGTCGQYKVSKFKYVWDTSATHTWTGSEGDWISGALLRTPTTTGDYYLHLRSYNVESIASTASLDLGEYWIDADPPSTPTVTDDGAMQTDTTQLHAHWTSSTDSSSGVCGYEYAIGTTPTDPGSGYIVPWKPTTLCEATESGLTLQPGSIYYWYVKAKDCVGNWGAAGVSDGIAIVQDNTGTIGAAKMLPDGSPVWLTSQAVAAKLGSALYIQDSASPVGIRVQTDNMPSGMAAGKVVDVGGKILTNSDGERYIQACVLDTLTTRAIRPVGMNNKWLGGADWNYDSGTGAGQQGADGGAGLNNFGLLVTTWGKVVSASSQAIQSWNFDTDPGWTMQGQWAYGTPTGGGSNCFDPAAGYTGTKVIGYNLSGDYANSMSTSYYATTPAIDCSGFTNVHLQFQRWLGVESASYDHAGIQASNDGSTWATVWNHTGGNLCDGAWLLMSYDISAIADHHSTVYIRWSMGPTDSSQTYPGWNIDDVDITGQSLTIGIDDGSGVGVQVLYPAGAQGPALGDYTTVTGISSCIRDQGGKIQRLILALPSP